jgi:hypothetical protein
MKFLTPVVVALISFSAFADETCSVSLVHGSAFGHTQGATFATVEDGTVYEVTQGSASDVKGDAIGTVEDGSIYSYAEGDTVASYEDGVVYEITQGVFNKVQGDQVLSVGRSSVYEIDGSRRGDQIASFEGCTKEEAAAATYLLAY